MTDIDPTVPPVVDPPASDDTKVTNPPAGGGGDDKKNTLEYWQAEAEKWKGFSRKHEDSEKALLKENTDLKTASMSDAEKAIENARKEGESTGVKKSTDRLVKLALRATAAEKGASLPDLDALNLAKFANEDGEPDETAIEKFVSSLGTNGGFAPGSDLGIGHKGGSGVKQWTRADLNGKQHEDVVAARKAGHLDKILGVGEFS